MPRPRVKDEDRKRVLRACSNCKRRKEKCNGEQPCLLCRRRGREDQCHYPDGGRGSHSRTSVSDRSTAMHSEHDLLEPDDAEIAIESLLTLSSSRNVAETPQAILTPTDGTLQVSSHAPVPKLARLLQDGHGKFIFVGDSSTLAFLQNVRRLVKEAIGECPLTTDPKRHAMVEVIPSEVTSSHPESCMRPRPTRSEAQDLIQHYLLATTGVIDLFDRADIMQHLLAWTENAASGNSATSSIFYLVLAIGAQNRATSDEEQTALYFKNGRQLAVSSFMDDPSVLTVQSYILIAFYMLTSCRRNGAFMLLGIAIRAAYALGLHRTDISVLFEARERHTRERVWKSLRVLDIFLSASLGRPPATSEVDGGNVLWEGASRGYENVNLQALHSSAMLRICFIFERILNEVYCRREVSVQLVDSISRQYRDWKLHPDSGLQDDTSDEGGAAAMTEMQKLIGLAHLKGAYYWSIILLTRPFLIFDVSSNLRESEEQEEHPKNPETVTLSEACIDAALRSIDIASEIVRTPHFPVRPIFVTNSVFVSTLVVGAAILGGYDKSFPLLNSLDQVKQVLGELAKFDPAARRFALITTYLKQAVLEHVQRRDERRLLKRRRGIQSIFGNILNQDLPTRTADVTLRDAVPGEGPSSTVLTTQSDLPNVNWPQMQDGDVGRRDMTITTSGVLTVPAQNPQSKSFEQTFTALQPEPNRDLPIPIQSDKDVDPSFDDEFPLFSLMDEFDSMNDPFLMDFM